MTFTNLILRRLSDADLALVSPLLEPVECGLADVLVEQDREIAHTYFLGSGIASLVPILSDGLRAEGGIIGREGYVTPSTLLRSKTVPYKIEMQMAGAGQRIASDDLLAATEASASLRDVLQRFAHVLMVQMSYSVASNAVHNVEVRLARWLLMCHDRSDTDVLALTHNFIGAMLGAHRPSVSVALHMLEERRLVRVDRGHISIRDRFALEMFAGSAYGRPEAVYRQMLGPFDEDRDVRSNRYG